MDIKHFDSILKFISTGIGVRPVGSNGLNVCKDYIAKKFADFSLPVSFQEFDYQGTTLFNVISELYSSSRTDRWILFVAHYDTVPTSRGAIDNASGIAAILEIARSFLKIGGLTNHNMRFIALAGEEVGAVGSKAYLSSLTDFERKNIECAYNFDMFISKKEDSSALVVNTLGGYFSNNYRYGIDEIPTKNIIARAVSSASKEMGEMFEVWSPRHYGHSDHQTFHEYMIDSANVTIRGNKASNGKLPSVYHSEGDIYDKSSFNYELLAYYLEIVERSVFLVDSKSI